MTIKTMDANKQTTESITIESITPTGLNSILKALKKGSQVSS